MLGLDRVALGTNLVSAAGLLPAVVLAERIGLSEGRYLAGRRTYPGSHVRP